jgi:hypothetical protein
MIRKLTYSESDLPMSLAAQRGRAENSQLTIVLHLCCSLQPRARNMMKSCLPTAADPKGERQKLKM